MVTRVNDRQVSESASVHEIQGMSKGFAGLNGLNIRRHDCPHLNQRWIAGLSKNRKNNIPLSTTSSTTKTADECYSLMIIAASRTEVDLVMLGKGLCPITSDILRFDIAFPLACQLQKMSYFSRTLVQRLGCN
jgi:hypothetical protein